MEHFEKIKYVSKIGTEYWYGRELQEALDYAEWRNFISVIQRAKQACEASGFNASDHFVDVNKTINLPKGATRKIDDIAMNRYACYLVMQNADPSKDIVAKGQTYFAIQTRRQEVADSEAALEDSKRLSSRSELAKHNSQLADAAHNAGVISPLDYATFQNEGYKGLYGGMTAQGIKKRKMLKKSHQILDYMGSEELAANLFRATQTEAKLRREGIKGKATAGRAHNEVGKKVRETIKELGGTMPESLPTPEKSIKQLEREQRKLPKAD